MAFESLTYRIVSVRSSMIVRTARKTCIQF